MPKHKKKKKSISGMFPNFLITGSFLMTLVIGLLVGYNQLQQKYQDEKWAASEKQDERIEEKIDDLASVINKRMETDSQKIEEHTKKIAILWQQFKDKITNEFDKNTP